MNTRQTHWQHGLRENWSLQKNIAVFTYFIYVYVHIISLMFFHVRLGHYILNTTFWNTLHCFLLIAFKTEVRNSTVFFVCMIARDFSTLLTYIRVTGTVTVANQYPTIKDACTATATVAANRLVIWKKKILRKDHVWM